MNNPGINISLIFCITLLFSVIQIASAQNNVSYNMTFYSVHDGTVLRINTTMETFSMMRNNATGTAVQMVMKNETAGIYAGATYKLDKYSVFNRSIFTFDTRALPDNAVITGGYLSLNLSAKNGGMSTTQFAVTTMQPGNSVDIATTDYNRFTGTEATSRVEYASWLINRRINLSLTTGGTNWVNKTGFTVYEGRLGWDVDNDGSGLSWVANGKTDYDIFTNESVVDTTRSSQPVLFVNYDIYTITTNNATFIANTLCVQFNGTNTGAATDVWFEYAMASNEGWSFKTLNQTATGDYFTRQCGMPFLSGKTYKYRARDATNVGSNVTFVIATTTPNPTLTYSVWVDQFLAADQDPKQLIRITWLPYTSVMGGIFFGVLVAMIFWNLAVKDKTIALSVLLMMIMGGTIWGLFPDYPEFVWLAQTLFIAGMVGMIYWMFSKRRK